MHKWIIFKNFNKKFYLFNKKMKNKMKKLINYVNKQIILKI